MYASEVTLSGSAGLLGSHAAASASILASFAAMAAARRFALFSFGVVNFWRGAGADFVWDDALIYMLMTDRFVNGNASNDPAPLPNAAQGADWMGGDFAGVTAHIDCL